MLIIAGSSMELKHLLLAAARQALCLLVRKHFLRSQGRNCCHLWAQIHHLYIGGIRICLISWALLSFGQLLGQMGINQHHYGKRYDYIACMRIYDLHMKKESISKLLRAYVLSMTMLTIRYVEPRASRRQPLLWSYSLGRNQSSVKENHIMTAKRSLFRRPTKRNTLRNTLPM